MYCKSLTACWVVYHSREDLDPRSYNAFPHQSNLSPGNVSRKTKADFHSRFGSLSVGLTLFMARYDRGQNRPLDTRQGHGRL